MDKTLLKLSRVFSLYNHNSITMVLFDAMGLEKLANQVN